MKAPAENDIRQNRSKVKVEYGCLGHLVARNFIHGLWIGGEFGCALAPGIVPLEYSKGMVEVSPIELDGETHTMILGIELLEQRLEVVKSRHPYLKVPRHLRCSFRFSSYPESEARKNAYLCSNCTYPLLRVDFPGFEEIANATSQKVIETYLPHAMLI